MFEFGLACRVAASSLRDTLINIRLELRLSHLASSTIFTTRWTKGLRRQGTVGHKSHDPCFHKKYMEAGVMTLVAYCTSS